MNNWKRIRKRSQRRKPVLVGSVGSQEEQTEETQEERQQFARPTFPKYDLRRRLYREMARTENSNEAARYLHLRADVLSVIHCVRNSKLLPLLASKYIDDDHLQRTYDELQHTLEWLRATRRLPQVTPHKVTRMPKPPPEPTDMFMIGNKEWLAFAKLEREIHYHSPSLRMHKPEELAAPHPDAMLIEQAEARDGYSLENDLADLFRLADRIVRIIDMRYGRGPDNTIANLRARTIERGCTPEEAASAQRLADRLEAKRGY